MFACVCKVCVRTPQPVLLKEIHRSRISLQLVMLASILILVLKMKRSAKIKTKNTKRLPHQRPHLPSPPSHPNHPENHPHHRKPKKKAKLVSKIKTKHLLQSYLSMLIDTERLSQQRLNSLSKRGRIS